MVSFDGAMTGCETRVGVIRGLEDLLKKKGATDGFELTRRPLSVRVPRITRVVVTDGPASFAFEGRRPAVGWV